MVWDTNEKKVVLDTQKELGAVVRPAFSGNGKRIYIATTAQTGPVHCIDADSGEIVSEIVLDGVVQPTDLALSSDGKILAVGRNDSQFAVSLYNAASGERVDSFTTTEVPRCADEFNALTRLRFAGDTSRLLLAATKHNNFNSGCVDSAQLIDEKLEHPTGARTWAHIDGKTPCNDVTFLGEGLTAQGLANGMIAVCDASFEWPVGVDAARAELFTLFSHKAPIYRLAGSPAGDTLAAVSADGEMRVWDVGAAMENMQPACSGCLAESPSVAGVSEDGTSIVSTHYKPVWETREKEICVELCRPVPVKKTVQQKICKMVPEQRTATVKICDMARETRTKNVEVEEGGEKRTKVVEYTVCVPVWKERKECYTVHKPVWETRERTLTVYEYVKEQCVKTCTYKVCKMVPEQRTVPVDDLSSRAEKAIMTREALKSIPKTALHGEKVLQDASFMVWQANGDLLPPEEFEEAIAKKPPILLVSRDYLHHCRIAPAHFVDDANTLIICSDMDASPPAAPVPAQVTSAPVAAPAPAPAPAVPKRAPEAQPKPAPAPAPRRAPEAAPVKAPEPPPAPQAEPEGVPTAKTGSAQARRPALPAVAVPNDKAREIEVRRWVSGRGGSVLVKNGFGEIINLSMVEDLGNDDLRNLMGHTQLASLDLAGAAIDDKGLKHLRSLESLKELDLSGTKVTEKGVTELKKSLPDCKVRMNSSTSVTAVAPAPESARPPAADNTGPKEPSESVANIVKWIRDSGGTAGRVHTPGGDVAVKIDLSAASGIDDRALARIADLGDMQILILSGKPVTGEGLKHVARLKKLTALRLDGTEIKDADLGSLEGVPLTNLDLRDTAITEAALEHLKRISTLKGIWISEGRWSKAALDDLKKTLPDCTVSETK